MLKALDANEVISTSLEAFFISIPWFAWQLSALALFFKLSLEKVFGGGFGRGYLRPMPSCWAF